MSTMTSGIIPSPLTPRLRIKAMPFMDAVKAIPSKGKMFFAPTFLLPDSVILRDFVLKFMDHKHDVCKWLG